MPDAPTMFQSRVRSNRLVAVQQHELTLDATADLLAQHLHPGQYCHLGADDSGHAHYALWSTPAEQQLRFLVRAEGARGERLAAVAPGERVAVSAPTGPGFALDRLRGLDVAFVATGTGIAPVRAALATVLGERAAWGELSLYYGVRTPAHVALGAELAAWAAAGVHVRTCFSRPDAEPPGLYVQDALAADEPDASRIGIVVAGHEPVVDALREWVVAAGAPTDRVLLNH